LADAAPADRAAETAEAPAAPTNGRDGSMDLMPPDLAATIVLLRHGESVFITEGRFQGRADSPLSPLGERQAALAGHRIAAPDRPPALPMAARPPVEIVHSPLQRTTQTARFAAASMTGHWGAEPTLRPEPNVMEIAQGAWEGMFRSDVDAQYGELLARWRRTPLEANAPGGERVAEVAVRARATLERVIAELVVAAALPSYFIPPPASPEPPAAGTSPDQPRSMMGGYPGELPLDVPWTLIVAHDGIFKVLLLTLFDLPLERFWSFPFSLCGLSVIELRDGRPILRLHNSTEHLAPLLDELAQAESEARLQSGAL
jgi:probable phosphoglycerate mutase